MRTLEEIRKDRPMLNFANSLADAKKTGDEVLASLRRILETLERIEENTRPVRTEFKVEDPRGR